MITIDDILHFWFEEVDPNCWFAPNEAFDRDIRRRFEPAYELAVAGGFNHWRDTGRGCVALCILFDQFPRHMFRGTPRAFVTDGKALAIARHAIDNGFDHDTRLTGDQRLFLYLPLEHSEDPEDQRTCVELMERIGKPDQIEYARQHKAIIDRFGRFPHRNTLLGRETTPEEAEFLGQPGSSF
jgi:uncharacterized protein (DUF924 family)